MQEIFVGKAWQIWEKIVLMITVILILYTMACGRTPDILSDPVSQYESRYQFEGFNETAAEENFYEYEIKTDETGIQYVVLMGFKEEYKTDFKEELERLTKNAWNISFPETLEDIPVKEIAANAFQNVDLGSCCRSLELSSELLLW